MLKESKKDNERRSRYESEVLRPTAKIAKGYEEVISAYESLLEDMSVEKFSTGRYSAVYLIENSLVVAVSLDRVIERDEILRDQYGREIKTDWDDSWEFGLVIEELTYNEVFDFNFKKFRDMVYYTLDLPYEFVDFRRFKNLEIGEGSKLEEVASLFPELQIEKRRESWEGVKRNFVVFECVDGNRHGVAVGSTNQIATASNTYDMLRDINDWLISSYALRDRANRNNDIFDAGISFRFRWIHNRPNIAMNDDFWTIAYSKLDSLTVEQLSKMKVRGGTTIFMSDCLTMSVVPKSIKDLRILSSVLNEGLLEDIENGRFAIEERFPYTEPKSRWRQEELMVKCVSSVFGPMSVLTQFSPFFLGSQSYDAYVKGQDIAFEYQGEQHFRPIAFFGGEEAFAHRVELDERKRRLSAQNGVKLIYVNYWEEITVDLIREKVKELSRQK